MNEVAMKFVNVRARALFFNRVPDDECGSIYGLGWGGLYLHELYGGTILEAQSNLVTLFRIPTEEDMASHWNRLCDKFELSGTPDLEAGDYVVEHEQRLLWAVTPGDMRFASQWDAVAFILQDVIPDLKLEDMAAIVPVDITAIIPNIWICNSRKVFTMLPDHVLEIFLREL